MKEIIVDKKYEGKKLNTFLLNTFSGLTMNTVYKLMRKKDIRINDVRIRENTVIHTGDHIKVYLSDEQLFKIGKDNINQSPMNFSSKIKKSDIQIVYEDDNICIVNKPAGIEVVGENALTSILLSYYQHHQKKQENQNKDKKTNSNSSHQSNTHIQPCHRLDRNTTGLVLFSKNEQSLEILLQKFKNREIEKHYLAKVYGIPSVKKATLTAYLFKDSKKSMVYISDVPKKGYEKIITSYEIVKTNKKENTSILDVNLHTGKTHQIRAHLAHIGYPIIGDGKYGNNQINKLFSCKVQQLCSYSLTFHFQSDSRILNYLNNKKFQLQTSPFLSQSK